MASLYVDSVCESRDRLYRLLGDEARLRLLRVLSPNA